MSLSNLVRDGGSEGSAFGSRVAGRHTELIEEPGFLRELLDEPPAGLDSFGSEENCPELDSVLPSSAISVLGRFREAVVSHGLTRVSRQCPSLPRRGRIDSPRSSIRRRWVWTLMSVEQRC